MTERVLARFGAPERLAPPADPSVEHALRQRIVRLIDEELTRQVEVAVVPVLVDLDAPADLPFTNPHADLHLAS